MAPPVMGSSVVSPIGRKEEHKIHLDWEPATPVDIVVIHTASQDKEHPLAFAILIAVRDHDCMPGAETTDKGSNVTEGSYHVSCLNITITKVGQCVVNAEACGSHDNTELIDLSGPTSKSATFEQANRNSHYDWIKAATTKSRLHDANDPMGRRAAILSPSNQHFGTENILSQWSTCIEKYFIEENTTTSYDRSPLSHDAMTCSDLVDLVELSAITDKNQTSVDEGLAPGQTSGDNKTSAINSLSHDLHPNLRQKHAMSRTKAYAENTGENAGSAGYPHNTTERASDEEVDWSQCEEGTKLGGATMLYVCQTYQSRKR